jgi:hypothetical protein
LVLAGSAFGDQKTRDSIFQYAGGTEKIDLECAGRLEVRLDSLSFNCPAGSVSMPFSAITLMQFRPDVSRHVRKIKLKWTTFPSPLISGKTNRYFTVVYKQDEVTHVVVLKTDPDTMRPYLAEIELKSGKRVEVMTDNDDYS